MTGSLNLIPSPESAAIPHCGKMKRGGGDLWQGTQQSQLGGIEYGRAGRARWLKQPQVNLSEVRLMESGDGESHLDLGLVLGTQWDSADEQK